MINSPDIYLYELTTGPRTEPIEKTLAACMEDGKNKHLTINIQLFADKPYVIFCVYDNREKVGVYEHLSDAVDGYNEI